MYTIKKFVDIFAYNDFYTFFRCVTPNGYLLLKYSIKFTFFQFRQTDILRFVFVYYFNSDTWTHQKKVRTNEHTSECLKKSVCRVFYGHTDTFDRLMKCPSVCLEVEQVGYSARPSVQKSDNTSVRSHLYMWTCLFSQFILRDVKSLKKGIHVLFLLRSCTLK